MRVLVDECAPKDLKSFLAAEGYECMTVQEAGWSGKENGELLDRADGHFDVLLTLDRKLRYQQTLLDEGLHCSYCVAAQTVWSIYSHIFPHARRRFSLFKVERSWKSVLALRRMLRIARISSIENPAIIRASFCL